MFRTVHSASLWWLKIVSLPLGLLALSQPSVAQMTPISEGRDVLAEVWYLGEHVRLHEQPVAPFASFESSQYAYVPNPDPDGVGSAEAYAYQISQFTPSFLSMSGATSGGWQITPIGWEGYNAQSNGGFHFRVDSCVEYQLDAWIEPGNDGPGYITLQPPGVAPGFLSLFDSGELHETGRLGPGEYTIGAYSVVWNTAESSQGATYTILWTCVPCSGSLIGVNPDDVTAACGGTATFAVAPSASSMGITYQWRRNFIPITNDGHVSGATSRTLVITNACDADSGTYDVVLSDGSIVEPSRMAHLRIVNTPTAVEAGATPSPRIFSIASSGPSPFGSTTSFRYSALRPQRAKIAIYNAAGTLVRTLIEETVSGTGVLTWDGTARDGSRASAGIYFLRTESDAGVKSIKVVLLR